MPESAVQSAREQMPAMSFLEHLEELRKRIIWAVLGVAAAFGACFFYADRIFALMQRPIIEVLHKYKLDDHLVYTTPTEPFNLYLKIGLLAGLFVASPWVLYQVWLFVSPGLYRHEKRYIFPFLFMTAGLFVAGGLTGYFLVYPPALDFLIGYGAQFRPMITVSEYTNLFLTIIIGMGLIFEMPILVMCLAYMGVISPGWMWKYVRYSILGIFVLAAIVTPTTDIVNMCVFAAPMVGLYFISIGLAWMVHPTRRRKRAEAAAAKGI